MGAAPTVALLVSAGLCLVLQNLLMVRITLSASTVLVALVINSAVGLTVLLGLLLIRNGAGGVAEAVAALRPGHSCRGCSAPSSSSPGSSATSGWARRPPSPSWWRASWWPGWRRTS